MYVSRYHNDFCSVIGRGGHLNTDNSSNEKFHSLPAPPSSLLSSLQSLRGEGRFRGDRRKSCLLSGPRSRQGLTASLLEDEGLTSFTVGASSLLGVENFSVGEMGSGKSSKPKTPWCKLGWYFRSTCFVQHTVLDTLRNHTGEATGLSRGPSPPLLPGGGGSSLYGAGPWHQQQVQPHPQS